MKPIFLIPLTLSAACIGYALGVLGPAPVLAPAPAAPLAGAAASTRGERVEPAVSEAAAAALAALGSPKSLEDFANVHGLLASLQPGDFPRIIALLQRSAAEGSKEKILLVFQAWIACDRAAACAWGRQITRQRMSGLSFSGDSVSRAIAEEWASKFRDEALTLARENWPREGAGHVLQNVMSNWPRAEYPAFFAQLQSFSPGAQRKKSMMGLFFQWGQADAKQALTAAKALAPGVERDSAMAQVIVCGGQRDPQKAFAQAQECGLTDARFFASLGYEAGVSKAVETSKWMVEKAPELLATAGPGLAAQWAKKEPLAALAWALANGVPIIAREQMFFSEKSDGVEWDAPMGMTNTTSPLDSAIYKAPKETVAWLRSLPASAERDDWLLQILGHTTRADALSIFAEFPPEKQAASVGSIARFAFRYDSAKAYEWAASLPAGALQDEAWRGIGRVAGGLPLSPSPVSAGHLLDAADFPAGRQRDLMLEGRALTYTQDAKSALEQVAKISDPATRRRVFETVMWGELHFPYMDVSKKAQAAMEQVDFPAEWKTALRESLAK